MLAGVIVPGGRGSINGSQMIITKFNVIGLGGLFWITNLGVHSMRDAYQSVNRLNSIYLNLPILSESLHIFLNPNLYF